MAMQRYMYITDTRYVQVKAEIVEQYEMPMVVRVAMIIVLPNLQQFERMLQDEEQRIYS